MKRLILYLYAVIAIVSLSSPVVIGAVYADNVPVDSVDLFFMDLEELMEIRIGPSSITSLDWGNDPACVTVITSKDIELTPARTLLDLLEIYVPGMTYVDHYKGPRFGMRGILGDQNYSFLLLVNGINMNLISSDGPLFEITNRDLNDIEKIEIARGPGSVTYGPGAIGGVINITTKQGSEKQGLTFKNKYNLNYRYNNTYLSYSKDIGQGNLFLNGSISRSLGLDDTKFFYVDRAHGYGYGFMDKDWGDQGLGTPAPNLMEDYFDRPEIKLNLNYQINNNWKVWSRFSTYNQIHLVQERKVAEGNVFTGHYGASFLTAVENKAALKENLKISTQGYFSSKSIRDLAFYNGANESIDHVTQRNASYSENIVSFKSQLNYFLNDRMELAGGTELSYQYWGPEWGTDKSEFVMSFQPPIRFAVLDKNSEFLKTFPNHSTLFEGKIDGSQTSFFGEMNWKLREKTTLLVSSRLDKHIYSDWALSPRVALLNNMENNQHLKMIWQHSVRLPNFITLFSGDKINNSTSRPEILEGFELIYSRDVLKKVGFQLSSYYQTVDQIAWRGDLNHADEIGNFDLLGFEAELSYIADGTRIGISSSYINQLDWNPVIDDVAFVTHTDGDTTYFVNTSENRINNLPRNTIKTNINQKLPYNITLHFNGRLFWNYGQDDMLDMFMDAHNNEGTPESKAEMQSIYDTLLDEGYTRPSFTSNMSLTWERKIRAVDLALSLYAMNIVSVNNIRYVIQYWETGNLRQYPRQCGFSEEPFTLGFSFNIKI